MEGTSGSTQAGKFQAEVDKRFGSLIASNMTTDALNRANEQIRDYIKRYNDTLTQIINKNLISFNTKKKKPATVADICKVLQQEIKNNRKIEQMDMLELKKLQEHR